VPVQRFPQTASTAPARAPKAAGHGHDHFYVPGTGCVLAAFLVLSRRNRRTRRSEPLKFGIRRNAPPDSKGIETLRSVGRPGLSWTRRNAPPDSKGTEIRTSAACVHGGFRNVSPDVDRIGWMVPYGIREQGSVAGELLDLAFTEQRLLDGWDSVREAALSDGDAGPEVERSEAGCRAEYQ
jgi:hypothetical protein